MPSPSLTGFTQTVVVGIADLAVSNNPNVGLTTPSLGSCIGVTIYDPVVRVGGLVNVMLPDSNIDPARAATQPAMFVDTAIPAIFCAAGRLRAETHRLQVCVAGGAQVMDSSGFFSIGRRNYQALTRWLARHDLIVQAKQVGGRVSRAMSLDLATGKVRLRISGQPQEVTLWHP